MDTSSAARPSQNVSVRRVGPFKIFEIINKNAVRLDLPQNISIHPVVHVYHTARAHRQPHDICHPRKDRARPFTDKFGKTVIEVSEILAHREKGRGWQFIILYNNTTIHEAEWKLLRDFIDSDKTITKALHDYITSNNILHYLH